MKKPAAEISPPVAQAAAEWVLRHDRGLSAGEQDAFSQWLAADERHREAFALHRWGWDEMDRLIGIQTTVHALPDPDLLANGPTLSLSNGLAAPRRAHQSRIIWLGSLALAAAAALAFMFFTPEKAPAPSAPVRLVFVAPIEQRTLPDGSVVELNRGAEIALAFTPAERRVHLLRGEANFQVAKDKEHPFIVSAGGVDVRAVGTAFNVRLGASAVEVVVSEGRVRIDQPANAANGGSTVVVSELGEGQSTTVSLVAAAAPAVATLDGTALQERLAWQPRLMDFTDAPLADIIAEFNRRNPVHIVLEQPVVGALRLSVTFRSDNVEGFVRLLESDFDLRAEPRGNDILLRRAR